MNTSRICKIYGERNSGTKLLEGLVGENFGLPVLSGVAREHMTEDERDLFFRLNYHRNLGWKHSIAPGEDDIPADMRSRILFLSITKNPYFWLLSLYRKPHHRIGDNPASFSEFLRTPWQTMDRDRMNGGSIDPVGLWNRKNASYLELPPDCSLNLCYEKYLEDPAVFIESIRSYFGLQYIHEGPSIIRASTTEQNRTYDDYKARYSNDGIVRHISREDLQFINQRLDRRIVDHFGYRRIAA